MAILYATGVLHPVMILLFCWLRIYSTSNMLNGWDFLELEFERAFGSKMDQQNLNANLKRGLKLGLTYPIVMLLISGSVMRDSGNSPEAPELQGIVSVISMGYLTIGTCLSQALYFLICYVTSFVGNQVFQQMESQKQLSNLSVDTVSNWKSVVVALGNQLERVSDWLASAGIFQCLIKLFLLTTSSYIILSIVSGDYVPAEEELTVMVFMATNACGAAFTMLFAEVYMAEKIHKAVLNFLLN